MWHLSRPHLTGSATFGSAFLPSVGCSICWDTVHCVLFYTIRNITVVPSFCRICCIAPETIITIRISAVVVFPNLRVKAVMGTLGCPHLTDPATYSSVGLASVDCSIGGPTPNLLNRLCRWHTVRNVAILQSFSGIGGVTPGCKLRIFRRLSTVVVLANISILMLMRSVVRPALTDPATYCSVSSASVGCAVGGQAAYVMSRAGGTVRNITVFKTLCGICCVAE